MTDNNDNQPVEWVPVTLPLDSGRPVNPDVVGLFAGSWAGYDKAVQDIKGTPSSHTHPQMQPSPPSTPDTNVNPAHPMTRLPVQFDGRRDQRAYVFTQLMRTGNVAVFQKRLKADGFWGGAGQTYEVVRIKENKAATKVIGGKEVTFPAHESMPSPEEWGINGWSFDRVSQAVAKFNELVALTAQVKG